MKWTNEQLKAIETRGKNLLVSASAGSGKTAVLIERIMTKLWRGEVSLDELLVVTFTDASAKEMKERLRQKLLASLHDDPQNAHLKRQLMLLPNAQISTFHAFCNRVIRKYFYLINADSQYQVGEPMELYLIQDEVLETLFLDLYEAKDEWFLRLVDQFTKERTDEPLKQIVLNLYDQLRHIPDRAAFEQQVLHHYDGFTALRDFRFSDALFDAMKTTIEQAYAYFKTAYLLARLPENNHHYQYTFESDHNLVERLLDKVHQHDYEGMRQAVQQMQFKRFNSTSSPSCMEETKKVIKDLRDSGRQTLIGLKKKYFGFHENLQVKVIKENKAVIESLFHLVHAFEDRYQQAKRDRGLVDFNDLEEMTLRIFRANGGNNEAVTEYRSTFKEILIDEYQDTNSMQEAIISAISQPNNRFMVGDVKQSIYRFRNAEPEIFQEKYQRFRTGENPLDELINLNLNFRCRKELLDFVNFLFMQVMDEQIGEIDYDEEAELKAGATDYPPSDEPFIEFTIINQQEVKEELEEEREVKRLELEAHYVAQKIRSIIDEGVLIYDRSIGKMRPARYSDIVILSRSAKNEQSVFDEVFREYHIPLLTSDLPGYFDSIEVLTITSFLAIIDNPLQDIPLVGVLRSPFYQLKERDLVNIQACAKAERLKSDYFYDKVKLYVQKGQDRRLVETLQRFLDDLYRYRELAKNEPLTELIYRLYHETNYYDFVKGLRGGKQRQANLDFLFERAKTFESITNNSLYKFVQLINFLKERKLDIEQARALGEHEDLVRFMTIHKAKGLEFPIVFLVNLGKRYNTDDLKDPVLFDKDLGVATAYFDPTYRVFYPSLYQTLMKDHMKRKLLAEEMRLLYVALTRAKERLYLVGAIENPDSHIRKFSSICFQRDVLIDASLRHVTNYLDLLIMAFMRHPAFIERFQLEHLVGETPLPMLPKVKVDFVSELSLTPKVEEETAVVFEGGDDQGIESVKRRLTFVYPKRERARHFAKLSVSDLKRLDAITPQSYSPMPSSFAKPRFYHETSAWEKGTATHQFMQHVDYRQSYQLEDLEVLRKSLVERGIMREDTASLIDLKSVLRFLQQPLVKQFQKADRILKERPFTTLIDASAIYPGYPYSDDVLVQGVIDLLAIFKDRIFLIDFKTDSIRDEPKMVEELKRKYAEQMTYYREAAQKLYPGLPVHALLYLFSVHRFVAYDE